MGRQNSQKNNKLTKETFELITTEFNSNKDVYESIFMNLFDAEKQGYANFISKFKNFREEYFDKNKQFAFEYNIFKILNKNRPEENIHSPFIKSLLDCNGDHGQGDLFYRLFIKTILKDGDTMPFILSNIKDYYVKNEEFVKNSDDESGRIDIFIESRNHEKKFVIIVENKWDSPDSCDNQIYKYYKYYRESLESSQILSIYLTKHGGNPELVSDDGYKELIKNPNTNFFPISYRKEIVQWLNKSMEQCKIPKINLLIEQYITLILSDYEQF
jgi:hypothetical protein